MSDMRQVQRQQKFADTLIMGGPLGQPAPISIREMHGGEKKVQRPICRCCQGTGIDGMSEDECVVCGGTGYKPSREMNDYLCGFIPEGRDDFSEGL